MPHVTYRGTVKILATLAYFSLAPGIHFLYENKYMYILSNCELKADKPPLPLDTSVSDPA